MSNIIKHEPAAITRTPDDVRRQIGAIQDLMADVMRTGVHYGVIEGVSKPTLYKSGAEKLNFLFRYVAQYQKDSIEMPNGHFRYEYKCRLLQPVALPDGTVQVRPDGEPVYVLVGEGDASCSSMESKYRYRNASRVCPECGKESIIKGKAEYGGGWVCFKKKDGCGAKFKDDDARITDQKAGQLENPDIEDVRNTVMKMAEKRALVAATLNACAASDIYTQDVEDMPQFAHMVVEAEYTEELDPPETKTPTPKPKTKQSPAPAVVEQLQDIAEPLASDYKGRESEYPITFGKHKGKLMRDFTKDQWQTMSEMSNIVDRHPELGKVLNVLLEPLPF